MQGRRARLYSDAGRNYLASAAERATDDQSRKVYESAVYLTDILDRASSYSVATTFLARGLSSACWGTLLGGLFVIARDADILESIRQTPKQTPQLLFHSLPAQDRNP